jgi:transposase
VDNDEIGGNEMSKVKERRRFSDEYKAEAVRLVKDSSKPVAQIARELGVNANVLYRWVAEEREANAVGKTRSSVKGEQQELAQVRRELERVTQERDFLRRAAAFFAREHK